MAMIRKCGISSSPTQTPLLQHHGRRRMTLGMLLLRPIDGDRKPHPRQSLLKLGIVNNEEVIGRNTLKDLMSSSKLFNNTIVYDNQAFRLQQQTPMTGLQQQTPIAGDMLPPATQSGGRRVRRGVNRQVAGSTGFRIRILKRAWRPVLGVIQHNVGLRVRSRKRQG